MNNHEYLSQYSKEQLMDLLDIYAKNWLAMDGVWFQSVERKFGMEEALFLDTEAWKRFTVIEARRIKDFLQLPPAPGLEGLAQALRLRFYANLNRDKLEWEEDGALVYTMVDCRVQRARQGKGMPFHPCKPVAILEYQGFAQTIDPRITCECLSCYPEVTDPACCCKWRFRLSE